MAIATSIMCGCLVNLSFGNDGTAVVDPGNSFTTVSVARQAQLV